MMQGRDVDVEDLFEVVRKVRLFEDDTAASMNRETQRALEDESRWNGCRLTI